MEANGALWGRGLLQEYKATAAIGAPRTALRKPSAAHGGHWRPTYSKRSMRVVAMGVACFSQPHIIIISITIYPSGGGWTTASHPPLFFPGGLQQDVEKVMGHGAIHDCALPRRVFPKVPMIPGGRLARPDVPTVRGWRSQPLVHGWGC